MRLSELVSRLEAVKRIKLTAIIEKTAREVSIEFGREQLLTSGRAGGRAWAGYAGEPKYAAYKMAIVGHLKPLRWEGQRGGLEDALTNASSSRRRWTRNGDKIRLTIDLSYVEQLERGGIGPFGERFPARPIFPAGPALERAASGDARDKFMIEVQRTGFKVTR